MRILTIPKNKRICIDCGATETIKWQTKNGQPWCHKCYGKDFYSRNRIKIKKVCRDYYNVNKTRIREKINNYYHANIEKCREQKREEYHRDIIKSRFQANERYIRDKKKGIFRYRKDNCRFSNLKSVAKRRGIKFILTLNEYSKLIAQPCFYCGDFIGFGGGLDRIDSTKIYSPDNVVPCCGICNNMKRDLNRDIFYSHILKIIRRLKLI